MRNFAKHVVSKLIFYLLSNLDTSKTSYFLNLPGKTHIADTACCKDISVARARVPVRRTNPFLWTWTLERKKRKKKRNRRKMRTEKMRVTAGEEEENLAWWPLERKKRTLLSGHWRGRLGTGEDDEGEDEKIEEELDGFYAKVIGTVT